MNTAGNTVNEIAPIMKAETEEGCTKRARPGYPLWVYL